MKSNLKTNYRLYQKVASKKKKNRDFFHLFLPEIIFRTTKLEGEPVTKKMIKSIFR